MLIVERHLNLLVAVLIVHIVNNVESVYVHAGEPTHHIVVSLHNLIIVKVLRGDRTVLRSDLLTGDLVHTAVDSVEKALGKVCSRAEELHLLTNSHRGNTASNSVIVTVGKAHKIVVLVLNGRGLDRGLCAEFLEVVGESRGPKNCKVRLGSRAEVVESVEVTVGHLGYHVTSVDSYAADGLGNPLRIAREERIILRSTSKLDKAELHNEVVDEFLYLTLGKSTLSEITLGIYIEEGRGSAE